MTRVPRPKVSRAGSAGSARPHTVPKGAGHARPRARATAGSPAVAPAAAPDVALDAALAALRAAPAFADIGARFARVREEAASHWHASVAQRVPAWRESRAPAMDEALAAHAHAIAADVAALLEGRALGDLDFVRAHARERAAHFFPLEAVLHAYRCLGQVLGRTLRSLATDASPANVGLLADLADAYVDAISLVAGDAYAEQAQRSANVADDERSALLDLLLAGCDEADRRTAERLRSAGLLDARQAFCVVCAQSVDAAHMRDPARVRRLVDALDALLPQALARRLTGVRGDRVVMILAATRRQSGWTAPHPPLSTRIAAALALAGNDVLIGVGPDVPSTGLIPSAHRRAVLAQRLAHVGERVRVFDRIPLREFVLQQAGPSVVELLPAWLDAFEDADRRAGGALGASLRAYAACNLNVLQTAAHLKVHPNTLYARFARIGEMTALDPRHYASLDALLLALDLAALRAR